MTGILSSWGVAGSQSRVPVAKRRGRWSFGALASAVVIAAVAPICQAGAQSLLGQSPAQLVPQGSPLPFVAPATPPTVAPEVPTTPPGGYENTAPRTPVAVRAVTIDGATIFPPGTLEALAAGLVGQATPFQAIEEARLQMVRRYREAGYVLVDISATRDASGVLRFAVIEGRIAEVKLEGDIGPAGSQVLRFLDRLRTGTPVTATQLERALLLAGDVPGVTVRSVLQPSANDPGALTLVAQLRRTAVNGLFAADNRAFRQTGPEEFLAALNFNSFTALGESSQVSLVRAFNNTQIFGQTSTEFFIGGSGLKLRVYAGAGSTTPNNGANGPLGTLGYLGRTTVFGTQLSYPLIRARSQTLNLVAAFDALESDITTNPEGDGGRAGAQRASFDSLRVLRGGVDYALEDLLAGGERPGVNTLTVRLSQGLTAFGASRNGSNLAGRTGERIDFLKVSAEASREQTLLHPWEDATVTLFGLVAGQASGDVLPPSEKFFLGGSRYNRGFYAGEVTGDNALTLSAELRLNTAVTVPVPLLGRPVDLGAQFYLFYDYGQTWENLKGDANRQLRSTGGGVRLTVTRYTEIDLEGVARLSRFPQGQTSNVAGNNTKPLKGGALYWRALTRF